MANLKYILNGSAENELNCHNYFYFINCLKVRHPNATRSVAIILLIIGNSSQKQHITPPKVLEMVSNHRMLVQHTEDFLPTLALVEEVFNDTALRKCMMAWWDQVQHSIIFMYYSYHIHVYWIYCYNQHKWNTIPSKTCLSPSWTGSCFFDKFKCL